MKCSQISTRQQQLQTRKHTAVTLRMMRYIWAQTPQNTGLKLNFKNGRSRGSRKNLRGLFTQRKEIFLFHRIKPTPGSMKCWLPVSAMHAVREFSSKLKMGGK